ncbi:MAG TPA: S49 family peptidase [Geminicoccaceae bacterium]|nr:S49 family peptidase [Geminicoccus sp.]HMU52558.1 S49 family peptidase [Geminicoccaceae bacterium]
MGISLRWPWPRGPVVPVIRLTGVIGSVGWRGSGMTLAALEPIIAKAFAERRAPAVALAVNSPGGSPVQSSLIAGRIRQLADEKRKPVLAFVEDVAASGGYWLACAADEIYVDAASIVGSIGVVSAGFGFADAIDRLGIERRLHSTGERKGMLDPFRPEREDDVAMLRGIQKVVLQSFEEHVRSRRGTRLTGDEKELFDGRIWAGREAVALGLVDGLGDLRGIVRQRFGKEARLRPLGRPRSWLQRRLGLEGAGGTLLAAALGAMEERALWARYGL